MPDSVPPARRYVSIGETADHLRVATKTVRSMIDDGRLRAYRSGRVIRLDLNEVDAAMTPFGGAA